jgi:hypothetical protein
LDSVGITKIVAALLHGFDPIAVEAGPRLATGTWEFAPQFGFWSMSALACSHHLAIASRPLVREADFRPSVPRSILDERIGDWALSESEAQIA